MFKKWLWLVLCGGLVLPLLAEEDGTQEWTATRDPDATTESLPGTPTHQWTATRNPNVEDKPLISGTKGSDYGLFTRDVTCLSIGLFSPVQLPWGQWHVRGIRLSPIHGRCSDLSGLDIGLWNTVDEDLTGLQVGGFNMASRVRGLQLGLVNATAYLKGIQIGLFNYADGAKGVQIGLINLIANTYPGGMPFIYGSF